MNDYLVFDSDDFGASHVISDVCQSRDCRDVLLKFKESNSNFKATLFTIPGELTMELANWARDNNWIELCWHGFYHASNYECENMSYMEFDSKMKYFRSIFGLTFVKGFKAPGWMISNDIYKWLLDNNYWVADQPINDERRPKELLVYKVGPNSSHHHCWDCVGNGVYEQFDYIMNKIKDVKEFRFVSEVINE